MNRDNKRIRYFFKEYDNNLEIIKREEINYQVMEEEELYYDLKKSKIDKARRDVVIRDLLYLHLSPKERRYIDYTFKYKMKGQEVADLLFISLRTYQRRLEKIYTKLSSYYKTFDQIIK